MEISAKKKKQFLDLYNMVLADGIVYPEEMTVLYRIGLEKYGFTEQEIDEWVKSAGLSANIPELPEEKIAILYEMAQIAWADGELCEAEKNMLRRYALRYGIKDESIDELVDYLLDKAKNNAKEEDIIQELNGNN